MDWLRSRLGFLQYISLHVIVGLILSFVSIGFFAELAEEVLESDTLVSIDQLLAHSLHVHATPLANTFFLAITRFGLEILWLAVILFGIYFAYKRQWNFLLMLVVTMLGGELLNSSLKFFFSRPRPVFDDPIITALHYSFPSGHAMLSFIGYGLLAYYLVARTPSKLRRLLIITAAVLLVALIGLSRIYLGVHYLSDVIAAYAAGAFWLSTCTTALYYLRFGYRPRKKEENLEVSPVSRETSPSANP
jgi:membrane-associated phospholipid phosphatase